MLSCVVYGIVDKTNGAPNYIRYTSRTPIVYLSGGGLPGLVERLSDRPGQVGVRRAAVHDRPRALFEGLEALGVDDGCAPEAHVQNLKGAKRNSNVSSDMRSQAAGKTAATGHE